MWAVRLYCYAWKSWSQHTLCNTFHTWYWGSACISMLPKVHKVGAGVLSVAVEVATVDVAGTCCWACSAALTCSWMRSNSSGRCGSVCAPWTPLVAAPSVLEAVLDARVDALVERRLVAWLAVDCLDRPRFDLGMVVTLLMIKLIGSSLDWTETAQLACRNQCWMSCRVQYWSAD